MINADHISSFMFYDALSGEFHPKTDSEGRAHTLGRLMLATFQKGTHVPSTRDTRVYTPSWAPDSTAGTEALKSGTPIGLMLQRTDVVGDWASFSLVREGTLRGDPQLRITGPGGLEIVGALQLGSRLNELREEAADVAQAFYDRLADKQLP